MSGTVHAAEVALRELGAADERLLFAWRNDPYIVERSSSRRSVSWEEHQRWFASVLGSEQHDVSIVTWRGEPVGQVRFDRDGGACVISAYLLEKYTGRALGVRAIVLGCERIARRWGVGEVVACVRADNAPGRTAFERAGFVAGALQTCPDGHAELRWMARKEAA